MITNEFIKEEMQIREELYGKLIQRFDKKENPKPFTTLLDIIKKLKIKPKKLEIMAYSIENVFDYYKNNINLLEEMGISDVKVYAYGEEKKEINYKNGKIEFIPLNGCHTVHFNLIYDDKNNVYLYYEPFHKDINNFFIDFSNATEEERLIYAPELRKPNENQIENIKSIYNL